MKLISLVERHEVQRREVKPYYRYGDRRARERIRPHVDVVSHRVLQSVGRHAEWGLGEKLRSWCWKG